MPPANQRPIIRQRIGDLAITLGLAMSSQARVLVPGGGEKSVSNKPH